MELISPPVTQQGDPDIHHPYAQGTTEKETDCFFGLTATSTTYCHEGTYCCCSAGWCTSLLHCLQSLVQAIQLAQGILLPPRPPVICRYPSSATPQASPSAFPPVDSDHRGGAQPRQRTLGYDRLPHFRPSPRCRGSAGKTLCPDPSLSIPTVLRQYCILRILLGDRTPFHRPGEDYSPVRWISHSGYRYWATATHNAPQVPAHLVSPGRIASGGFSCGKRK